IFSATARVMMSDGPPGGNEFTKRTGCDGKVPCAHTGAAPASASTATHVARRERSKMTMRGFPGLERDRKRDCVRRMQTGSTLLRQAPKCGLRGSGTALHHAGARQAGTRTTTEDQGYANRFNHPLGHRVGGRLFAARIARLCHPTEQKAA